MSIFYLIRHGANDYLGKRLAARLPGVHLNEEGRQQAGRLAETLARKDITRVISSPLERTVETAQPLAMRLNLKMQLSNDIIEVDFGDWSGATMESLDKMEEWKRFDTFRSGMRIPRGEMMVETQQRMVAKLQSLDAEEPGRSFALVSHGDPIRLTLLYYLGMPIDFINRIEISPGSFSVLEISEGGAQILCMNALPDFGFKTRW